MTDQNTTRDFFEIHFKEKYNIVFSKNAQSSILNIEDNNFEYIFVDLVCFVNPSSMTFDLKYFNEIYHNIEKSFPDSKKIIMAQKRHHQECILAIKLGIGSYINYPLVVEEVQYAIDFIDENTKKDAVIEYHEETYRNMASNYLFSSKSTDMISIIEKIESVASTHSTVLITGDTGTGKSVLAKRIHDMSDRRDKKFISVHCGSLPETLIESELFGHEKGAFTGAIKTKLGKFELANEGTLFLDEIGTLSEAIQIRLLQVLQERFIQRVGGEDNIEIDIRVIAATNNDLKMSVKNKSFREDLFYRLNVFRIEVPPLNRRLEDIEDLAHGIIEKFNDLYGKKINEIDIDVLEAFKKYSWPGNIREMENLIERAYILEKTTSLKREGFPENIFIASAGPKSLVSFFTTMNLRMARQKILNTFESGYINELLRKSEGDLTIASKLSGVSVRQIHKLMSKHNVSRKDYTLK